LRPVQPLALAAAKELLLQPLDLRPQDRQFLFQGEILGVELGGVTHSCC
jgi:hypothetical protein